MDILVAVGHRPVLPPSPSIGSQQKADRASAKGRKKDVKTYT